MDYARTELAEALAAQYVTGTLRGPARRRFEALLPSHPSLQRAVQAWQARLLPMTGALEEVAPPPRVWSAIEARLWPPPAPQPWWQRLGLWRAVSGLTLAALVGVVVLVGQPVPGEPPVVVVLQPTGQDPAVGGTVVASFSADGQTAVAQPIAKVSVQNDRALELWWAPEKGKPTSLGLIKADGTTVLSRGRLPGGIKGSKIDHLAVSVEPAGGSPTGQPTGPVVYYGKLAL